jgi:fatty acid-binding protein DegV
MSEAHELLDLAGRQLEEIEVRVVDSLSAFQALQAAG